MSSFAYCIATIVTEKAIAALLEGGGAGSYRDTSPWIVAKRLVEDAAAQEARVPIVLASKPETGPALFSHWAYITNIDVVELHRGQWESRVHFSKLQPINPIWEPIDSLFIKASSEQMAREQLEGLAVSRHSLDEHHIHPYAICESPAFVPDVLEAR